MTHVHRAMRYIFHYSKTVVAERFPEMTQQIVAGFFFLRFLCPALVSPENYGLALTAGTYQAVEMFIPVLNLPLSLPEKITSKSRRSLVLISKVLQNLANDVEFGDKEPYMTAMNHFIIRKRKSLQAFFNQLAVRSSPRSFCKIKYFPHPTPLCWFCELIY